jgi:hypothetical protein
VQANLRVLEVSPTGDQQTTPSLASSPTDRLRLRGIYRQLGSVFRQAGSKQRPQSRSLREQVPQNADISCCDTVAELLFTQDFPSVTPASPVSPSASCSNLQVWGSLPAGGGIVVFNCTGKLSAFVVYTPVTATPAFTLPANATDLYAFPQADGVGSGTGSCSGVTGALGLISGSAINLASGGWEYCVDATGAIAGFTISWSQ